MELSELMNYSATHWEPGIVTGPAATVGTHTFKAAALRPAVHPSSVDRSNQGDFSLGQGSGNVMESDCATILGRVVRM